jgi:hypothetical protein
MPLDSLKSTALVLTVRVSPLDVTLRALIVRLKTAAAMNSLQALP